MITVTTRSEITVVEAITVGPSQTANVTDNSANTTQLKFGPTSASPMSLKSHFAQALSAGSATIDLLALIGTQGQTLATTGLRVQAVKVQNPNANQLAVAASGSNGYALTFTVPPQGEVLITSTNLLGLIGSTAHLLTLTGTGTQTSNWIIVIG